MLCSVLEVFEELGLNVIEARASCVEGFQLQVIGEVKFTSLILNHDRSSPLITIDTYTNAM